MKEMIYKNEREVNLLDSGKFYDFQYYIFSFGTHPTAYVEIPENHKLYKKRYMDIEEYIDCHGGLTYSNDKLIGESGVIKGWFIGWDYAHAGDFFCLPNLKSFMENDKKWTTGEIQKEVENVCYQLSLLNN